LDVIAERGPITCDATEVITGLSHQAVSARIRELCLAGLIAIDGKANTRTGTPARTYVRVTNVV
jgi:hypothetical protein